MAGTEATTPEEREMDWWMRCTVSPGQFSSEYAVSAKSSGGGEFSLFAPKEFVRLDPHAEGAGWLQVDVWDRRGNDVLVKLPAPVLATGGQFVTVPSSEIRPLSSAPSTV